MPHYRVMAGINWLDRDGRECRAEAGDVIELDEQIAAALGVDVVTPAHDQEEE
jgi:hypothetical protein